MDSARSALTPQGIPRGLKAVHPHAPFARFSALRTADDPRIAVRGARQLCLSGGADLSSPAADRASTPTRLTDHDSKTYPAPTPARNTIRALALRRHGPSIYTIAWVGLAAHSIQRAPLQHNHQGAARRRRGTKGDQQCLKRRMRAWR